MYYILRKNSTDVLMFDTDLERITNSARCLPDNDVNDIKETDREIVQLGARWVFRDEHEQEYQEQEAVRNAQRSLAELDVRIANLKADMATAQLLGDSEWVSELQQEYDALLNGVS